jgi:hypothetical protein
MTNVVRIMGVAELRDEPFRNRDITKLKAVQ